MKKTNFTFLKGLALSTAIAATMWAGEAKAQLACQDHVNVSLSATCDASLAPANFLASGTGLGIVIMNGASAYGAAGTTVAITKTSINGVAVSGTTVGNTYTVKITANADGTGNACWGTVKFEDKLAPSLVCPGPVTVKCDAAIAESTSEVAIASTGVALGAVTAPVVDDCSSHQLYYSDMVVDAACPSYTPTPAAGPYTTKTVNRTYRAIDAYGNEISCTQTITFQRPYWTGSPIMGIVGNNDTGVNSKFDCNVTFAVDAAGNPAPSAAGTPTISIGGTVVNAIQACDLMVTYADVKLATCGNGYKVIRTWTILDWCAGLSSTIAQTIKVEDATAPTIANCGADLELSTAANSCKLESAVVPFPAFLDNCDTYAQLTKTVKVVKATKVAAVWGIFDADAVAPGIQSVTVFNGNTTGTSVTLSNLAIGFYQVQYTAADRCGNTTTCVQWLEVKDLVPPTPVCDLDTRTSLTIDGKAVVNAITYDDGSVDNCCLDQNSYRVTRTFDAAGNPINWATTVTFTCSDVSVKVALQVADCYGNKNYCVVNTTVEDKLPPVIFAASTSVICGDNTTAKAWMDANKPALKTLNTYPTASNPGYYDNCGATVTESSSYSIDNCGTGTASRTYTATDANGRTATAIQTYTSINASAYRVEFPADKNIVCGAAGDPYAVTAPIITALGNPNQPNTITCPVVSVEHTDETFDAVPGACFKILRKWKIMNFCQFTTNPSVQALELLKGRGAEYIPGTTGACGSAVPRTYTNIAPGIVTATPAALSIYAPLLAANACYGFDTDGYMEYVQVIQVNDTTAPTWTATPDPVCSLAPGCRVYLDIPAPTATDCTNSLGYSYQVLNAANAIVLSGSFPAAQSSFGPGQIPFGSYTIRYKATDKCGNYVSTDKVVDIKDKKKPTPVCYQGLSVALMPNNGKAMLTALMFDAGSYDNCTANADLVLRIESPSTAGAGSTALPSTSSIEVDCKGIKLIRLWAVDAAGNADYCDTYVDVQYPWEGAQGAVPVSACPSVGTPTGTANIAGAIKTETGSAMSADVNVTPLGFNTAIASYPGKAQYFSAVGLGGNFVVSAKNDANVKNGISTYDLVLINKHILGAQLLDSPYKKVAADVNNSKTITTGDLVELRKLILGINDKFTNNTSWKFVDKKQVLTTGNVFAQPLNEVINIANIQADVLNADFVAVKIGDVNGNALTTGAPRNNNATVAITADDQAVKAGEEVRMTLNASEVEAFQFTMNYNAAALELVNVEAAAENFAVIAEGTITTSSMTNEGMTFVFRAKQAGQLSNLVNINSDVTTAEAYNAGTTYNVALAFNNAANGFELFQNTPNPAKGATTISFTLPTAGAAVLTITDMAGRVVNSVDVDGVKGYNEVQVSNLAAGVFQYTLKASNNTATKKMVIIE